MNGEQLLGQALMTFEHRRANYGLARHHFRDVAKSWSQLLGHEVSPQQVIACMIELKLARLRENPGHVDSIIDIAGYAAVMAEVVSTDDLGGLVDERA